MRKPVQQDGELTPVAGSQEDDGGNVTDEQLRALQRRVEDLERWKSEADRKIVINEIKIQEGISGGAQREIAQLKETVERLNNEIGTLNSKTNRWEGGGSVLYVLVTVMGGFVGWIASRLGSK